MAIRKKNTRTEEDRLKISLEYALWSKVDMERGGRGPFSRRQTRAKTQEMKDWIADNCNSRYFLNSNDYWYFEDENEAVMFKLVFFNE